MTTTTASRVSFSSLTPNNIGTVRKLNSVLFPIKYTEKFYEGIINPQVEDFCKLVYYNDVPESKDGEDNLYLMTMGVLAPYRTRGLGSQTLQQILTAASSHTTPAIKKIYLHVQISNGAAKRFYEKHGFKEVGIHKDYYKKIMPHHAWILEKTIEHS